MEFIYSGSDIESVIMLFEDKIFILVDNIFVFYKKQNSYYVYHLYKYRLNNKDCDIYVEDRWDYQDFPIEPIQSMIMNGSNTLSIHIENFKNKDTKQDSLAIFKIFFTDKGIQRLIK